MPPQFIEPLFPSGYNEPQRDGKRVAYQRLGPVTTVVSNHTACNRIGVTLLELLVVIAMVGLLVAVLLPSVTGARQTASAAVCLTNLRQWSTAGILYAQNNDGFLPRRGQGEQATNLLNRSADWFNALPPLIGQVKYQNMAADGKVPRPGDRGIWMCPQAQEIDNPQFFAYAMNMRLSTWQAAQPDQIDRVAPTDRQVFLADAPGAYCSVLPTALAYSPAARHRGRVNLAFLDGHASGFAGAYIGCGVGDPLRPDAQWRVPNSVWPGPNP